MLEELSTLPASLLALKKGKQRRRVQIATECANWVTVKSSQAGLSGSLALGFVIPETPSPEINRGNESHQPYPGI